MANTGRMHTGLVTGSRTRSIPFRQHLPGLTATCKLPINTQIQHISVLLGKCRAFASTTTEGNTTHSDQEKVSKFVHSLSEEQAAAALAGDGHLRY